MSLIQARTKMTDALGPSGFPSRTSNFIRRRIMITRLRCLIVLCFLLLPSLARAQGVTTGPIDEVLGRSGQKTGDVYKVAFPRSDLHVSVQGLAIKPGLALGSWAAFLGTDDNAMVMGDLVLLEGEVNPVIAKLRSSGFEISAGH